MKKLFMPALICASVYAQTDYTLDSSINEALDNNRKNNISRIALEIASAQYEQAKSANYPTLNLKLIANRMKEDTSFVLKDNIALSADVAKGLAVAKAISSGGIPGNAATAADFALAGIIASPDSVFAGQGLPMDIKIPVAGRDTALVKLEFMYPLYTGGKISSIIEQAKLNKLLSKEGITRQNDEVVYDVKKYFYAYRLTNELYKLANTLYQRMKNLEKITKQFLEEGDSLKIKTTDYLNMQVTNALISSKVAELSIKKELAKSALVNVMGLKYNAEVNFVYDPEKVVYTNVSLENIIKEAHSSNSDIKKLNIALKIYDKKIDFEKASYYPDIALLANAQRGYNSYEYSYLNENTWNVSLVANIPIFEGFKTSSKINEQKLEKNILLEKKELLKDGISLLLKHEFLKSSISYKQIQTLKNAKKLAIRNRDLNTRAYQVEAVTPKEVIEAQLTEAYVKMDYLTYVHNYMLSLAKIENIIGTNIKN